ncbi:MAG TPA: riboflavin synthase [Chitinivibrionales bacterium]|nr:riboflavin synthase [Chitinivibrionales bacterium]
MFTGIIETLGTIREVRPGDRGFVLGIEPVMAPFEVLPGASVCVDGTCLTLESQRGAVLYFTAVAETLSRTTLKTKRAGDMVNLERALPVQGRLDGHFVLGHVDGVASIAADRSIGNSMVRTLKVPESLSPFCAEKGSIAVDGVSLTIAAAAGNEIGVALIPFTLEKTTLGRKRPGDGVNVECDVLARYLLRLLEAGTIGKKDITGSAGSLADSLERAGF